MKPVWQETDRPEVAKAPDRAVEYRLGNFKLGRLFTFTVLGDDPKTPTTVDLHTTVGQKSLHLLRITGVDQRADFGSASAEWIGGWAESGTVFSTLLYAETMNVVRRAEKQPARRAPAKPRPD